MVQEPISIKVKRIHSKSRLPLRASERAAGADLHCIEDFAIRPGERKLVPTGLVIEIPSGFYGRIAPRSGLAVSHGIDTLAGVIDSDYRGELRVLMINFGETEVQFQAGDRIAQLIVELAADCDYQWSETLGETGRGEGGFGSTG